MSDSVNAASYLLLPLVLLRLPPPAVESTLRLVATPASNSTDGGGDNGGDIADGGDAGGRSIPMCAWEGYTCREGGGDSEWKWVAGMEVTAVRMGQVVHTAQVVTAVRMGHVVTAGLP